MLIWDFPICIIFFFLSAYFTYLYDQKQINPSLMHSTLWSLRNAIWIPTAFLIVKVFLWDLYYYSKNYQNIINLISRKQNK